MLSLAVGASFGIGATNEANTSSCSVDRQGLESPVLSEVQLCMPEPDCRSGDFVKLR